MTKTRCFICSFITSSLLALFLVSSNVKAEVGIPIIEEEYETKVNEYAEVVKTMVSIQNALEADVY